MDELKILVQAVLEDKSIKIIKSQLDEMKTKYGDLIINLKVDSEALKTLTKMSDNIEKITQSITGQKTAIQGVINETNKETQAINQQTEALKQQEVMRQKIVTTIDKENEANKKTQIITTTGNKYNNTVTSQTQYGKDSIPIPSSVTVQNIDYSKMLDEAYKMNTDFDKKAEALDKAHYQALKVNQDKIEALDKLHYTALKQNRDIDYKNHEKNVADYKKLVNEAYKINDEFDKKAESLDKAHYQALKTDRDRTEALDKAHYMALKKNKEMYEKDFQNLLKQDETLDKAHYQALKSDAARAEALDKAHYQALRINKEMYVKDLTKLYNDAEKIDKAHYQALKTDRDRTDALDKQHYIALQQNANREQDFMRQKARLETSILDAQRRFAGDKTLVSSLDDLMGSTKQITSIGNYKNAISDADNQLKRFVTTANSARSNSISWVEGMKTALQKFPIWVLTATAFYAPFRALESGLQTIYDLDSAMTDLKKVTNGTTDEYKQFQSTANQTAKEIGGLTVDVIKSSAEWARLGYSIQQAQSLAKATIVYQNVGDIKSAEDASQALISVIKGFGIEVDAQGKNITKVIDLYNNIGNKFAISSAGIGDAMQRSAASLHQAGNTIEQSVALAVAANDTIQDPAKVGNSLKTIAMRIQGISDDGEDLSNLVPTLEAKFNSLGLTLKNSNDSFKSTYEIFKELSGVWNTLSHFQQSDILELVAGKLQGNIAASIIQNMADAQKALKEGLNSSGSAAKENAVYMNSLQGRINVLKDTISGFWQTSLNTDGIKIIISTLTSLVSGLDSVVKTFGFLPTVVFAATTAMLAFKSSIISTAILGAMGESLKSVSLALAVYTGSTVAARVATVALQATMTLGLSLAITAIISGITSLVSQHRKLVEEQKQLEQQNKQIADSWTNQKDKINELIATYTSLNEATKNGTVFTDTEQEQKYKDIIEQLSNLMPNLVSSIDEKGNKHLKNAEAIKQELAYAEKLANLEMKKSVATATKTFSKDSQAIEDKQKEIDQQQLLLTYQGRTEEDAAKIQIKILNLQQELATLTQKAKDDIDSTAKSISNLAGIKISDNVSAGITKIIDSFKLDGLDEDQLKSKAQGIANLIKSLNDINKIKSTFNYSKESNPFGFSQSEMVDALTKSYYSNAEAIGISKDAAKELLNAERPLIDTNKELASTTIDFKSIQSKLPDTFKNIADEMKPLNSALESVSKGESLSADVVADLILKYPQLTSAVSKTTDGYTINAQALTLLRDATLKTETDKIKAEVSMTNVTMINLQARLRAYGIEIEAIKNLSDAMAGIAKIDDKTDKMNSRKFLTKEQETYIDKADEAKSQLKDYGDLLDQITKLEDLAKNVGKSTPSKSKTSSSSPQLKDALELNDITKERINSYNEEYDINQKLIESQQKRIKLAEKDKDYNKSILATNDLLKLQQQGIEDLNTANQKISSHADDVRLQFASKYISGFDANAKNAKKTAADFFNAWTTQTGDATKAYADFINQFAVRSQQVHDNNKLSIKQKNDEIDKIAKEQKQAEDLFSTLQLLSQGWQSNTDKITQMNDEIEQSIQNIKNYSQILIDNAQKAKEAVDKINEDILSTQNDIKSQISSLADEVVQLYKDSYEAQKQGELKVLQNKQDALQKQRDAEKSAHDALMKELDAESKKYKDIYDQQIKAIDDQQSSDEYKKNLQKLQDEQLDIQKELSIALLNDDASNKKRREDLQKQLADKTTEITDLKTQHEIDARKKALQDAQDTIQKEIDDKKDQADTEEDLRQKNFESIKDYYDYEKELTTKKYDDLINDDKRFADIRQQVFSGTFDQVNADLNEFKDSMSSNSEAIGKVLSSNITDKINDMQSTLTQASTIMGGLFSTLGTTIQNSIIDTLTTLINKLNTLNNTKLDGIKTQFESIQEILQNIKSAQDAWNASLSQAQQSALHDTVQSGYSQLDQQYGTHTAYDEPSGTYTVYKNGQVVSTNPNEYFATHQPMNTQIPSSTTSYGSSSGANGGGNPNQARIDDLNHQMGTTTDPRFLNAARAEIERLGGVATHHKGGIVGGKSSRLTEIMNKFFNTSPSESMVKMLKGELTVPEVNIARNFMPNMSNLVNSIIPKGGNNTGSTVVNLNVNIDKMTSSEGDFNKFMTRVSNSFTRAGLQLR